MDIIRTIEQFDRLRNGAFAHIDYRTELPVCSDSRKMGIVVEKVVGKRVRVGCHYTNMVDVNNGGGTYIKTNNYTYLVPNKATYNTNTKKYYVEFYNTGAKPTVSYKVYKNGVEISNKDWQRHIISSYFNGNSAPVDFQRMKAENILKVGR